MARLVKVELAAKIPPGCGELVGVEGKRIAVFNVGGHYHAIDDTCPHRGGPLSEGSLEGEIVTCSWHSSKVNVTTGAVLGLSAEYGVSHYTLREWRV